MMKAIRFEYTNHRGETAIRNVVPLQIFFGKNEYYPEQQWLMGTFDLDRQDHRTFALTKCKFVEDELKKQIQIDTGYPLQLDIEGLTRLDLDRIGAPVLKKISSLRFHILVPNEQIMQKLEPYWGAAIWSPVLNPSQALQERIEGGPTDQKQRR